MKEYLTRNVLPDLPGLVVLSHGDLAAAFISSAEMICGKLENAAGLGVEAGEDMAAFKERLKEIIDLFPAGAFVLIDITCGTPFNTLFSVGGDSILYGMAGINLALLMDMSNMRHSMSLEEMSAAADEIFHASCCNIRAFQIELLKEDA